MPQFPMDDDDEEFVLEEATGEVLVANHVVGDSEMGTPPSTPVELEPFLHQVGGHSSMFSLGEETICKPLVPRELEFYDSVPEVLRPFTPQCHGVIQVLPEEDMDGYIRLNAFLPVKEQTHPWGVQIPTNGRRNKPRRRHARLKKTGSIDLGSEEGDTESDLSPSPSPSPPETVNPWVTQCQKAKMATLRNPQGFLLLENVTSGFSKPCILDLKMGLRHYGDDASPEKIARKNLKASNSTSLRLGVRICGMQVYRTLSGNYLCRDKYYGQKLNETDFKDALFQFLHNQQSFRLDALEGLLTKLRRLLEIVTSLNSFRFYTSSLLLVYEGEPSFQVSSSLVDVRMIDFAHSTHSGITKVHDHEGPDAGYMFGLTNLIATLETICTEESVS